MPCVGRILVLRRVGHLAGHRRDDLVALVDPEADELRQLLLERHAVEQGLHAVGDRRKIGADHEIFTLLSGRSVEGAQPLTAPVSPPTMRRSNRLKNTRAGIIDNDVNASTLAVSTEYCDENACTPSGSV